MSKRYIDWSAIEQTNIFDRVRERQNLPTMKQAFQKSHSQLAAMERENELMKALEPEIKASLLDHMINRKPIKVTSPFGNPTETLGGLSGDDEEDGFYAVQKSTSGNVSYQEVMETVPQGIELVFKSLDKQLGQWIFKGSNGKEYAIYDKPQVMFMDRIINNPGYYGLLYNTHIFKERLGEE